MESLLNNDNSQRCNALSETAASLVDQLSRRNLRIVFAESCTGGLVAATLTQIPGVSNWLCGSAVTYQDETKQAWLNVPEHDLRECTAVSEQVTRVMAQQVLKKTPQAAISVAVTGHLGPDAPEEIDGVVFIACASRDAAESVVATEQLRLTQNDRRSRQVEAAEAVLRFTIEHLEHLAGS